jgi:ferredoxin
MANIIFYFTGTGNSLKIAKMVSDKIGNCAILSTGSNQGISINKEYDSIGFIYPVYFWGVPKSVKDFISSMTITNNEHAYIYAVASCGGFPGDGLKLLNKFLLEKNIKLNYGKIIKIFSNYIINFDAPKDIKGKLAKCDKKLSQIIESIRHKATNSIGKTNGIVGKFYYKFVETVPEQDKNYNVSDDCIGCGICKEVCPVGNINIVNNRPDFKHHCEQCMACIQFCPKAAINYGDKTQSKKRYANPDISHTELSEMNKIKYNE